MGRAQLALDLDQRTRAAELYGSAISQLENHPPKSPELTLGALAGDAIVAQLLGNTQRARKDMQAELVLLQKMPEPYVPEILRIEGRLCDLDFAEDHLLQARQCLERVAPQTERRLGEKHPLALSLLLFKARTLLRLGDFDALTSTLQQWRSRATQDGKLPGFDGARVRLMELQVQMLSDAGATLPELKRMLDSLPPAMVGHLNLDQVLGEALLRSGQTEAAVQQLRQVEQRLISSVGADNLKVAQLYVLLAQAYARQGDKTQALSVLQRALPVLQQQRDADYFATVLALAYQRILSDAPGNSSTAVAQLAEQLQSKLGWQNATADLVAWLRAAPPKATLQQLPVVY